MENRLLLFNNTYGLLHYHYTILTVRRRRRHIVTNLLTTRINMEHLTFLRGCIIFSTYYYFVVHNIYHHFARKSEEKSRHIEFYRWKQFDNQKRMLLFWLQLEEIVS